MTDKNCLVPFFTISFISFNKDNNLSSKNHMMSFLKQAKYRSEKSHSKEFFEFLGTYKEMRQLNLFYTTGSPQSYLQFTQKQHNLNVFELVDKMQKLLHEVYVSN